MDAVGGIMTHGSSTRSPQIRNTSWREAYDEAMSLCEPIFVPVKHYCDDRGWSLMNLLAGAVSDTGQINVSVQYPGVIKAWHRHQLQADFWCCVLGHLRAGVYREDDDSRWSIVLGEKRPGVLIIPPTLWHGAATIGHESACLLYYMTHQFNPEAPDEERRAWDSVDEFTWGVVHR